MMTYTEATLTPINARYLSEHWISPSDIRKVNTMAAQIEARRQGTPIPQDGDIVIYVRNGETITEHAHLEDAEWLDEGEMTVCEDVYGGAPHISNEGQCSASGGPWMSVDPAELTYVGKRAKMFWLWGNMGACRNGGVNFEAEVNVWKLERTR